MADTSCPISEHTFESSCWSAWTAVAAAESIEAGASFAYALCRPPGHHAFADVAGGFCFFNNSGIAAQRLRKTADRVAILDVDLHHGNGSQQIFWRRGDVFYASIHADPATLYPFFLGHADEIGEGPGEGANLNQPLPRGTGDAVYLEAVDRALDAIARTRGSLVVVSLGFDTYEHDPIGTFALTTAVYHEVGRRTAALGRRLVILQEGGYHRPSLGENARAWLRGAEGRDHEPIAAGGFRPEGARMPA
jgi:acetoin utilization deacetylase AcuC-like enzyme